MRGRPRRFAPWVSCLLPFSPSSRCTHGRSSPQYTTSVNRRELFRACGKERLPRNRRSARGILAKKANPDSRLFDGRGDRQAEEFLQMPLPYRGGPTHTYIRIAPQRSGVDSAVSTIPCPVPTNRVNLGGKKERTSQ